MPTRSKPKSKHWWEKLDQQEVRTAFEEATVDAYGEDEQHTGLLTMIQDAVEFPFRGKVLGEEVDVVGIEWPDGDAFGLDLVCERNGEKHRVEARSVELLKPLPEGHLFIAAYHAWRRVF